MDKVIQDFIKKFNIIRNMGYVKAINDNNSGIGLTFENLLGKKADCFPLPDFQNTIEIKTKLAFSKRPIHLFKLTPDGNDFVESKRLLEKYGYHYGNSTEKKLNITIYSNTLVKCGLYYYFSLTVNYKEEKVIILIYNNKKQLIDAKTYWDFKKIENAIARKIKYLALIQVWPTNIDGIKHYKYFRYNIYKYSNFYNFLHLLNIGIISITISIDVYTDSKKYGKIHDHGISFDIYKNDLEKLFYQLY